MTKLTGNQEAAMTTLIKSCIWNMGGETLADLKEDPCTWVDVEDLVKSGWSQKSAEGTFGSLVAQGLIYEDEINRGQILFSLTQDWDELSKYSDIYFHQPYRCASRWMERKNK